MKTAHFKLAGAVLLFAAVLGTFFPAVKGGFVGFDDPEYITGNLHIQQGLTWASVGWAFSSSAAANWHPLTWLSHMLDVELFGLQPWGHHLSAIALHALSVVVLFLALRRLTGAAGRSLVVALLFGLHPLRVESVAWVSERKDVLSTLFWVLTLWAYAGWQSQVRNGKSTGGGAASGDAGWTRTTWLYYAASLVFFALGLMSKSMLVTLPCVLLLLDYWPLGRWPGTSAWKLLVEKVPFFLAALAVSVTTYVVQREAGAMSMALPLGSRIANAFVSYARYIGKLFWPVDLAFFYPPPSHWPVAAVVLAVALLAGVSAVAFALRDRYPWLLVGWLWYVGTLVPVIGLVQVGEQAMADRYSYVPSVGLLLALVWGGQCWLGRGRWSLALVRLGVVAAVLLCAGLTRAQIRHWRDSESLFRHALRVTKNNYLAHNNLGTTLDKAGREQEALAELEQAVRINPGNPEVRNNLGVVLDHLGRFDEAIREYENALKLRPRYAEARLNLGTTLERMGRFEEAFRLYQEAVRLKPGSADAHYNLGLALGRQGRFEEAITEFQESLRLQPNSPDAHNNLGLAYMKQGRVELAIAEYRKALELKPDYARAYFNLGAALSQAGNIRGAIVALEEALRLKPDYAEARANLEALRGAQDGPGATGVKTERE